MNVVDAFDNPVFIMMNIRIDTFKYKLIWILNQAVGEIVHLYLTSTYQVVGIHHIYQQRKQSHELPYDHYYHKQWVLPSHLDMYPFTIHYFRTLIR